MPLKMKSKKPPASSISKHLNIMKFLLFLLITIARASNLRTDPPAEDAVENTNDPGCIDGLVFKDTLDITRSPPGPHW
tara:strand:- start:46 stop:279 length:234 start_codon:yes stop_codon:yes gene_type:complete